MATTNSALHSMSPMKTPTDKVLEAGAVAEIKDLYKEGKASCSCCIAWGSEPQKKLPTAAITDTDGYAILARKTEGHGDFGRELKLHSIVIQSVLIREVLDEVLKGYPGITSGLDTLTVEAPFSAFYHRWTALMSAYTDSADDKLTHLGLLIKLLEVEFEGLHKNVANLLKNKVIESKYIWAIFQPGDYICTTMHGQDTVLQLENFCSYDDTQHGSGKGWTLTAKHIDYNGSMMGFGTTVIKIPGFNGSMPLTELEAYPLDIHHDKSALVEKLVLRGKRYTELRVGAFQEYSGKAYVKDASGYVVETQVDSRVMVDPFTYHRFNRHKSVSLRALSAPSPGTTSHVHKSHILNPGPPGHIHRPPPPPPALTIEKKACPNGSEQKELSDEQLLICVPFVKGYSFKNKEWVLLNIEFLCPIQWTEDLFENLVLPTEEKDLLLELTRSHSRATATFDDFVIGKGKGMIVLLDGPPGVGKTLTAESVAEDIKAPLYTMSAGELGTDANTVETRLSDILELTTMWNAILLIDEADIFMEKRSLHDLERNEFISIFLRHLEYFKGVMILTTNRAETMDPAVDSRVDIRLHYPDLDAAARRKVWVNFVAKFEGLSIEGADLDDLAKLELNGREIKNIMKTAYLLAGGREETAGLDHVRAVLKLRGVRP